MKPISTLTKENIAKIKYVLHDIDDTITNNGKLLPETYLSLWKLHKNGYKVIPVTGRSAGWCSLIIHQWPVDAVIGENGAFVYYKDSDAIKTFTSHLVVEQSSEKLKQLGQMCMDQVTGCNLAPDQFSRKYDLAVDFSEHVPDLGMENAVKIKNICESYGATAKISSIHVNAWFGNYDKVSTAIAFLQNIYNEDDTKNTVIFFGDSPNDEPMFKTFPISCAVANIMTFKDSLTYLPTYVTKEKGGYGFVKAIEHILSL